MSNDKKFGDLEVAALGSAAIILCALIYYWGSEVDSTIELLKLAYGELHLFNNPLDF
jgi:hypothetical protein